MRILITGISGFAGGHLAARLLRDGHEVHGTVHQHTSGARLPALADGGPVLRPDALSIVDVGHAAQIEDVLRRVRPDAIFHLAGTATVGGSEVNPARVFTVNALGTLHLLAAMRTICPNARVVTVGSGSAYGLLDGVEVPVTEEAPFRPLSPYGASKAAADLIAHQWTHAHELQVVRVRPFNHIGPGQSLGFICPDVALQLVEIERGKRPPVVDVGNVDVVRDFTDVRDIVDGYVAALERGVRGEAYNVCSGLGLSVRDVISRMIEISGLTVELRTAAERLRKADVPIAIGSPEKLERATGWRAQRHITDTLRDVLADWRAR